LAVFDGQEGHMSLAHALATAKTEEDVKDAYVKAIGLKTYSKGWVDIQADNIWFEAKEAPTAAFAMFAQLLCSVRGARLSGLEHLPPVLAVVDREKAAIFETELALPVIEDSAIDWPKAPRKQSTRGQDCTHYLGALQFTGSYSSPSIAVARLNSRR
jgi:hypothetical protein